MEQYVKEFLEKVGETRPTYRDMIEFCCDSMILNNSIITETMSKGYYWETYTGSEFYYTDSEGERITEAEYYLKEENGEDVSEECEDFYQYFIISGSDADRLATYTEETVFYCEELDLYILGVSHWGTAWNGVPANWKDPEEEKEEEAEA